MTHCERGLNRSVPMRYRAGNEFMVTATIKLSRNVLLIFLWMVGAQFCASAQDENPTLMQSSKTIKLNPLPLNHVRLTGGPLKASQEADAKYLLELQPDRMLAFLRQRAGLKAKAEGYGGWDGPKRNLTGHIAGHYLSAVSLMWAATGDARFKERATYIVEQLKEIQDAQGDGYIGALEDGEGVDGKQRFVDLSNGVIKSGGFDLNGLWSPWYVEHKLFAGLRDAYRYADNATALQVEIKFAGWVEKILSKLSDDQLQRMLATEFGGMNEVLAELYADTADERWLVLADKFHQKSTLDSLAEDHDVLAHTHGNTQVPKVYGALMRYVYTGNEPDAETAKFFWDRVVYHYSFATGGHGKNEYFGEPDKLDDMVDGRTAETCNVYNMLKMTRALFSVDPDIRYTDFHERALFNHILASQDPRDGTVSYMLPVGRGVQHEYQRMFEDFTCCVGTSMESHALHGAGIYYYKGSEEFWVGLYAPSIAKWDSAGVEVEMKTDFPLGESAAVKIRTKTPKKFMLALRRPYWAGDGFSVKVNGQSLKDLSPADSYVKITRVWRQNDTVELNLPKVLRKEPLPDNPNRMAVMWGPLVLAGDLGAEVRGNENEEESPPAPSAPAIVVADEPVQQWLKPESGKPGWFKTTGVGLAQEIEFAPFYELPRRKYAVYWDVFTPEEWNKRSAEYKAEQEKQEKLQAATIAFAQPGEMQSERDFNEQGEDTAPVLWRGRHGRGGKGWFSFDVPVENTHPVALWVTYGGEGYRKSTFDILIDGKKVGTYIAPPRSPEQDVRFVDTNYTIPAELVGGKSKVTVRFQATDGNEIRGVFGLRTVRDGEAH
jgi:uncharacterized protein